MSTNEIDEAALNASDWHSHVITVLRPGPETRALIPQPWWPIADSTDLEERRLTALALWNREFLNLIPRFAEALAHALVDVRVAKHNKFSAPSLDYALRDGNDELVGWAGQDPRTFGDQLPPLFDSVPQPVQSFLREVHAGFTTYDSLSCGVRAPRHMETLADMLGMPDDNEMLEWEVEDYDFPGTQRLLVVSSNDSLELLTSPDLPAGSAVTYFEPDYEIRQFGPALDTFMRMPLGR